MTRASLIQATRLAFGGAALITLAAGCGSAAPHRVASRTPLAVKTKAPRHAMPVMHVRIISPHPRARTGRTILVRVAVKGGAQGTSERLLYVLDGRRARPASARFFLRRLSPGRHHLVVMLASQRSVKATASFVVRKPPPPAPPPPSPTPTTSTTAPTQTTSASSPPTQPSSPPPHHHSGSGSSGSGNSGTACIPQGKKAGDGDADNQGAPSDGDGCV